MIFLLFVSFIGTLWLAWLVYDNKKAYRVATTFLLLVIVMLLIAMTVNIVKGG